MRTRLPFFILILIFSLSSCFHKDVMSDRADDVEKTFIYSGKEGNFIITVEQVFQATSKESGGGVTTISGHADYRITSYDLNTGVQTGRVNMGDQQDNAFTVMGTTPGKIWVYSSDPDLGFHSRNPKTLEVIADEKTLTASGPLKGFAFARPEWMKLKQHYGWSADNGNLVLTDMQGFHYYFDPQKNTLNKTDDEIIDYNWATQPAGSTAHFTQDEYVSLRGDGRQKLQYKYEDSTAKLSYLNGELLLDINPLHDAAMKKNVLSGWDEQVSMLTDSIRSLQQKFPKMNDESRSYSDISADERAAKYHCENMERDIESYKNGKESINRKNSRYLDDAVLNDGDKSFFVLHGTDVTDTSHLQLTKVNLDGRKFTEAWTIRLNDFYRDPDKANSKGAFETVFSDGNPSFRYQYFEIAANKLVMISQLQMICIDTKTGKTLWEHPL